METPLTDEIRSIAQFATLGPAVLPGCGRVHRVEVLGAKVQQVVQGLNYILRIKYVANCGFRHWKICDNVMVRQPLPSQCAEEDCLEIIRPEVITCVDLPEGKTIYLTSDHLNIMYFRHGW